MARRTLTDIGIKRLKPGPKLINAADPELAGHYVRITPAGAKSFYAVARNPAGKQIWTRIGPCDPLTIAESRERARQMLTRIKAGLPAVAVPPAAPLTFGELAESWMTREGSKRITAKEMRRTLDKYILPTWKNLPVADIRKLDVTKLLDDVEDKHGTRMADLVYARAMRILNWHAARDDDYRSPIAPGSMESRHHNRKRERILDDAEIRRVWLTGMGTYGDIIKLLLLTGQRENKIASMRWDDIDANEWRVPHDEGGKGTAGWLTLPPLAMSIIDARPRVSGSPYVFPATPRKRKDGTKPKHSYFSSWSSCKARLDEDCGVTSWTLHDLRRTFRSLASRCGITENVAERALGHALPGVKGVYDRWHYKPEKADTLLRLASTIERLLNPQPNVVALRG